MPEPIRANRSKLSQLAKRFLRQLQLQPHPLDLYILQLCKWAVEQGELEVDDRVAATLERLLLEEEQDQATVDLFETNEAGDRLNLVKGPLTPRLLAFRLLDSLESRMVVRLPNYRLPKR